MANDIQDAEATATTSAHVVLVCGQLIMLLSQEASTALPSRGQVAVVATIAGHEFSTVVEPDGYRGHWIRVDQRLALAISAVSGTDVAIRLAVAERWPEPDVPDDLSAALAAAPDITDLWHSITSMARWEWVRWVNATANPATRERRIEVSISKLRSGKRRPCCFDLSACTDPQLSKSGKLIARR